MSLLQLNDRKNQSLFGLNDRATAEPLISSEYAEFIDRKSQLGTMSGFEPRFMPGYLFDFQKAMVDWSVRKGRAALFEDCGLGKTIQQLVWAQNVVEHTNKPVLILTPLAVSYQTVQEAKDFDIEAVRAPDGLVTCRGQINVTNYERLHLFNPDDFAGVVCDESSILKNFDGKRKGEITEFMRKVPHRLLCTATAAPNDFIELGTSSEALGELGYMDMLNKFFRNTLNNSATGRMRGEVIKWRLKGHAELPFWRWICSWARAIRRPSDIGFDDAKFVLPALIERQHIVDAKTLAEGYLFPLPAVGLKEQREERKRTIVERCDKVAELAETNAQALVWCHLNEEGKRLAEIIPGAIEVSGKDSDDAKEEKFLAFSRGEIRVLVTKPKIGAFGLNFQNCAHVTFFPSHSFEQYYQGVRRCWRFGQKRDVRVDVVTTEGEQEVMKNLQRKARSADRMFDNLVREMNNAQRVERSQNNNRQIMELPSWLLQSK